MSVLSVPALGVDGDRFPSLGGQVCDFIESFLCHGPGDLRGHPITLDQEKRGLIWRMYEVYPKDHDQAGRRRFKRCAISLRKGSAKTELAALIAAVELHSLGPVRCDGFDANGDPVGVGVNDPYIPLVAYTEEQSDDLAYSALRVILEFSPLADDFDIGLTRIMRIDGDGKAVSLATAPDSRDGARTTFQLFDETHRFYSSRLKAAHKTMLANVPKRYLADPWSLETTTAPSPGQGSVAESTMEYARQVANGKISDSRLFFFHRQASDDHDLTTEKGIREAVIEASGPVAGWSDIGGICVQWQDPTADRAYLERVWLNRLVRSSERAFDIQKFDELSDPDYQIPAGALVTLGFDGARWHDSTGLVATEVSTGFQSVVGLWEKPELIPDSEWEVPIDQVESVVAEAFDLWRVWRMYCDPPYWESLVAGWSGQYGEKIVLEWWTNRVKAMAYAIKSFNNAIQSGDMLHDGNKYYRQHLGNAVKKVLTIRDENGNPLFTIYKERSDSPFKIDLAMAGILSWEARNDALSAGVNTRRRSAYEDRGLMVA